MKMAYTASASHSSSLHETKTVILEIQLAQIQRYINIVSFLVTAYSLQTVLLIVKRGKSRQN